MGCFDYGCAVTNVAIKQYEPVLHVVVLDKRIDSAYEIILALDTYKREKDISRRFFLGEHRYQLSDEDRQEIANQAAEAMLKRQFMINFGTYNDYGWISEVERGELHPMNVPNFMVKRSVAEEIARQYGELDVENPVAVLRAVATFLFVARINPSALDAGRVQGA